MDLATGRRLSKLCAGVALLAVGCSQGAHASVAAAPPPASASAPPAPAPTRGDVEITPPVASAPGDAVPPPAPPAAARKAWPCRVSAVVADDCAEKDGVSEVEGWVVAVHACQPCPPRAMCKPCEGEYVMLSDTRKPGPDPTWIGEANLRVVLPSPPAFRIGQRVKVRVHPAPLMFIGDPCCQPGRYVAHLVP